MLSKAQVKLIRSLQQKKYREEEGLFVAEGKKIVEELLTSEIEVRHVFCLAGLPDLPQTPKGALIEVSQKELEAISALTTPQGILAVCKIPGVSKVKPDFKKELVLALDDIRDPGNMGSIIRIADWFGINHIYCSEECVDVYNSKVVQASMGSIARVHVHYTDIATMLKGVGEGIPVYGALLSGKSIYKEKLTINGILVIGNESTGISAEIQKLITKPISIPAYKANGPESLNAGVATAILCAEFMRK